MLSSTRWPEIPAEVVTRRHRPTERRQMHEERNASEMRAMVVGAGIGGLTAAIALRRAGVETTVFERRRAPGGWCRVAPGSERRQGARRARPLRKGSPARYPCFGRPDPLLVRGDTHGCACGRASSRTPFCVGCATQHSGRFRTGSSSGNSSGCCSTKKGPLFDDCSGGPSDALEASRRLLVAEQGPKGMEE